MRLTWTVVVDYDPPPAPEQVAALEWLTQLLEDTIARELPSYGGYFVLQTHGPDVEL